MSPLARARAWAVWAPAALHASLIWVVSSMSNPDFVPVADVPLKDKGVHFLVFGALGAFLAHGALRTWPAWPRWRVFLAAVVATALWGALDEAHQYFVPGRDSDSIDVLADVLGGVGGAALRVVAAAVVQRSSARPSPLANADRPRETHPR